MQTFYIWIRSCRAGVDPPHFGLAARVHRQCSRSSGQLAGGVAAAHMQMWGLGWRRRSYLWVTPGHAGLGWRRRRPTGIALSLS